MDVMYEYTFGIHMKTEMYLEASEALREIVKMTPLFTVERTEEGFAEFRAQMYNDGFELMEISRRQVGGYETVL